MKRYDFDEIWSVRMAEVRAGVPHTEWIFRMENGDVFTVDDVSCGSNEVATKLVRMVPSDKKMPSGIYNVGKVAECIPIFSTERGWKWNREQILRCIEKYPDQTQDILNKFFDNRYNQPYVRKIFGKHFKAVMREINSTLHTNYAPMDLTPQKVSKEECKINTSYFFDKLRRRAIENLFDMLG